MRDKNITPAVVKSNQLIEASYQLNRREQYFILHLISQLDSQNQKEFTSYTMTFEEIQRVVNYGGKRRLSHIGEVESIMDSLNSKPIRFEDENVVEKIVWISSLKYHKKKKSCTFSFDPKLKAYLLELQKSFTKYYLKNVDKFSNAHSFRIYELAKRYEFKGGEEIHLDKLKYFLDIEGKYPKFYELKRRILEPTKEEINRYTDLVYDYEIASKTGKKIESIRLIVRPKKRTISAPKKKNKMSYEDITKKVNAILVSNPSLEQKVFHQIGRASGNNQKRINEIIMEMYPDKFKSK